MAWAEIAPWQTWLRADAGGTIVELLANGYAVLTDLQLAGDKLTWVDAGAPTA